MIFLSCIKHCTCLRQIIVTSHVSNWYFLLKYHSYYLYVVAISSIHSWWRHHMETFSGLLCGEFAGHQCIPGAKASDAELWCFLWSASEPTIEQRYETPVIGHRVSDHRPLECLFNSLFGLTSTKYQSPHYWPFVKGIHPWPVNSLH